MSEPMSAEDLAEIRSRLDEFDVWDNPNIEDDVRRLLAEVDRLTQMVADQPVPASAVQQPRTRAVAANGACDVDSGDPVMNRPLNWSQRVTMQMIAEGRGPSGGEGVLDTTGLGIPGGTLRSLHQRGLIERASWFEAGWALTRAGVDLVRSGGCDDPESGDP